MGRRWLVRPKRPAGLQGCALSLSLSLIFLFNRKEIREKKIKEGLGKGFVQGAIFLWSHKNVRNLNKMATRFLEKKDPYMLNLIQHV